MIHYESILCVWVDRNIHVTSFAPAAEFRGQFVDEKATEVWLFDFGLRVGIEAIEALHKIQVSR